MDLFTVRKIFRERIKLQLCEDKAQMLNNSSQCKQYGNKVWIKAGNKTTSYMHSSGQTESKKSKKHGAGSIETKGTAMSFGFRKKLNTTPKKLKKLIEGDSKKKHDKCNNISDDDVGRTTGAVIDTEIIVTNENIHEDDNGNSDTMPKVYFEKMGAAAAGGKSAQKFSTNQGVPEQSQTANRPGAGNRFGYRGCNVARPASTGITGRYRSDSHENVENNNCTVTEGGQQKPLVSNRKY
ncbi:uncharacterized protein LOC119666839 [Teleopsis dalmanni]|uniref:uncharacterized protein LOC119666839 n=1 Tax=Teleopsis dalmanni TaxID=139649 RepID=UPI0018CF8427|nr:uncharacterized protein LOC119666839 [Teleopsis dalmanni]